MNDLITILTTPLFWIASAIGSVLLGIVGNLLTPKVASYLDKRSSSRRTEARKSTARLLGEVLIRSETSDKLTQTKLDVIYAFLLTCVLMLFALVLFSIASVVENFIGYTFVSISVVLCGFPVLWLALFTMRHGIKMVRIVRIVERRNRDLQTFLAASQRTEADKYRFLKDWDQKEFGISWDDVPTILGKEPNKAVGVTPHRSVPHQ